MLLFLILNRWNIFCTLSWYPHEKKPQLFTSAHLGTLELSDNRKEVQVLSFMTWMASTFKRFGQESGIECKGLPYYADIHWITEEFLHIHDSPPERYFFCFGKKKCKFQSQKHLVRQSALSQLNSFSIYFWHFSQSKSCY